MDVIFSGIAHETKFWKPSKGKTYAYWLDDQDKINSVESSSLDQQPISLIETNEPEISNPIMDWVFQSKIGFQFVSFLIFKIF